MSKADYPSLSDSVFGSVNDMFDPDDEASKLTLLRDLEMDAREEKVTNLCRFCVCVFPP